MSALSVLTPYPMFADRTGAPLTGGRVYLGVAGANPITNPITAYFDSALTIPAAQPVRTSGGYPLNTGSPARLFVDATEYSIVVQDSAGATVYSALRATLLSAQQTVRFERSAAEISAGVTVVDYTRQWGDFVRYGLSTSALAATNATAINAALSCNAYCFCHDAGTYTVSSTLNPTSNQSVFLAQGVVLQASVKNWAGLGFWRLDGITNFRLDGGVLDGNKANNPSGELIGVLVLDSSTVKITNVVSKNCPSNNTTLGSQGDGFFVGGSAAAGSTDVLIQGCTADANVRQGISLVRGSNIRVIGNNLVNTSGNNPGGGIDIEANDPTHTLRDITIQGNTITGNHYGLVVTTAAKYVSITGNTISDNRFAATYIADCDQVVFSANTLLSGISTGATPVIEVVSANDAIIADNIVIGNQNASEGAGIRLLGLCSNIKITGNKIGNTRVQGLVIGSSTQTADFSNITVSANTFTDCVLAATAGVSVIGITGNSGSGFYPRKVSVFGNQIIDTRTGGNEADAAFSLGTFTGAVLATLRIEDNHVSGPAAMYLSGVGPLRGTVSFNPGAGSLADGAGATSTDVTIAGAEIGDRVEVYAPYDLTGGLLQGNVKAADTVNFRVQNESGGVLTTGAGTWGLQVVKRDRL